MGKCAMEGMGRRLEFTTSAAGLVELQKYINEYLNNERNRIRYNLTVRYYVLSELKGHSRGELVHVALLTVRRSFR